MNNNFVIDDGVQTYTFSNQNGELLAKFSFNPADTGILQRYEKVVDFLNNFEPSEDLSKDIIKLDKDLREQINYLLNRNVSDDVFAVNEPCALVADGDFFAEKVLEIIAKIVETETGARLKKKAKKISKYTQGYKK